MSEVYLEKGNIYFYINLYFDSDLLGSLNVSHSEYLEPSMLVWCTKKFCFIGMFHLQCKVLKQETGINKCHCVRILTTVSLLILPLPCILGPWIALLGLSFVLLQNIFLKIISKLFVPWLKVLLSLSVTFNETPIPYSGIKGPSVFSGLPSQFQLTLFAFT